MDFASSQIQRAWLSAASPEAVYAWLKAKGEEAANRRHPDWWPKDYPAPDKLLEELASRNERLIDLGLAQYGSHAAILRRFWLSGDAALRHAVAANRVIGPHLVFFLGDSGRDFIRRHYINAADLYDTAAHLDLARSDDVELQRIFFANPRIRYEWLSEVFDRNGIYSDLPDEKWVRVISFAIRNPNLQKGRIFDPFATDPGDELEEHEPIAAVWRMLLTISPTARTAGELADGVFKVGRLELPCDEFLDPTEPTPDVGSKEWSAWRERRELALLRKLFERWTDENVAEGEEWHSYRLIRQAIASRVPSFQSALQAFIREYPDPAVRSGYYQTENYTSVEKLRTDFERDGRVFLEAAVDNVHLCLLSNRAVADAFDDDILLHADFGDWEALQHLRARRHHTVERYHSQNPSIFLSPERPPAELSDDQESQSLKEVRKLAGRIEILSTSSDRAAVDGNLLGEVLNSFSQLLVKISERLETVADGLGDIRRQWAKATWVALAVFVALIWLSIRR